MTKKTKKFVDGLLTEKMSERERMSYHHQHYGMCPAPGQKATCECHGGKKVGEAEDLPLFPEKKIKQRPVVIPGKGFGMRNLAHGDHEPDERGCKYRGNDAWDCGHIDNEERHSPGCVCQDCKS